VKQRSGCFALARRQQHQPLVKRFQIGQSCPLHAIAFERVPDRTDKRP
jgi:hypothetical protein